MEQAPGRPKRKRPASVRTAQGLADRPSRKKPRRVRSSPAFGRSQPPKLPVTSCPFSRYSSLSSPCPVLELAHRQPAMPAVAFTSTSASPNARIVTGLLPTRGQRARRPRRGVKAQPLDGDLSKRLGWSPAGSAGSCSSRLPPSPRMSATETSRRGAGRWSQHSPSSAPAKAQHNKTATIHHSPHSSLSSGGSSTLSRLDVSSLPPPSPISALSCCGSGPRWAAARPRTGLVHRDRKIACDAGATGCRQRNPAAPCAPIVGTRDPGRPARQRGSHLGRHPAVGARQLPRASAAAWITFLAIIWFCTPWPPGQPASPMWFTVLPRRGRTAGGPYPAPPASPPAMIARLRPAHPPHAAGHRRVQPTDAPRGVGHQRACGRQGRWCSCPRGSARRKGRRSARVGPRASFFPSALAVMIGSPPRCGQPARPALRIPPHRPRRCRRRPNRRAHLPPRARPQPDGPPSGRPITWPHKTDAHLSPRRAFQQLQRGGGILLAQAAADHPVEELRRGRALVEQHQARRCASCTTMFMSLLVHPGLETRLEVAPCAGPWFSRMRL